MEAGRSNWIARPSAPASASGAATHAITDVHQASGGTAELPETRALLDAVLENASAQIYVKDLDGRYLVVNREVERASGFTRAEMLGRTDAELFPGADIASWNTHDRIIIEQGEPIEFEEEFDGPEGPRTWLSRKFPLVDETGRVFAIGGVSTDITERTAARAKIDAANNAKSDFLSRMSHELRTPLNAVIGFAQLLEMDDLSPDHHESVAQILKGGRHLLELINEVLDIARIESGRLTLSVEQVDVDSVISEVLDLMRPLAEQRTLTIERQTSEPLLALADRQRLRQVLLNLVSNAVKYTPEHGTITIIDHLTIDGPVAIEVRDTGPGIAPQLLDRLFQPFERLGAEATTIEGTGMGLTLSKGLTEAMNGSLAVRTEVGAGSTFTVTLPAAEAQDSEAFDPKPLDTGSTATSFTDARGLVLYIEDNLHNLRLVERIIERRPNIQLVSAGTGRLGLDLAHAHGPALVLLDLHLPDIHGTEVLRHLKRDPATCDIPVVVLSADATPRQRTRLLRAGAHEYLTKPVIVTELLALIDSTLTDAP